MNEAAFLSAIVADPADDTNRLVYADWLEERGDMRAEYIRLRLKVREPHRRTSILSRLSALADDLDVEWRQQVFAVPKLSIEKFTRVKTPITKPVTKFGGQPVWVDGPAWPISSRGERMQFVCQVAVPDFFGPALAGKMVYVFAVHPEFTNWEAFCGRISPLYPDEGDNAVVIQPGGDPPAPTIVLPAGAKGQRRRKKPTRVAAEATGPTLYDADADPDYTCNGKHTFPSEAAWQRYWDQVYGSKIGGTPAWGNGLSGEVDSLAVDPDWCMLLHYTCSVPYFTVWEAGFDWYVFVSRDGKRGFLMGGR